MTTDDHAKLLEVKYRLAELSRYRREAEAAADWPRVHAMQDEIAAADAERVELMRRTEPEDEPQL